MVIVRSPLSHGSSRFNIASVALPYMAGNLGRRAATPGTQVLTSYLMPRMPLILPISGWLAGTAGQAPFMICLGIFTS